LDTNPRDEIVYARYVYGNSSKDDYEIRNPIARHWARHSHTMRHEVGDNDFKSLCLEFPEFAFDVLTVMLDKTEKSQAFSSAPVSKRPSTLGLEGSSTPRSVKKRKQM
jgi:hypothetical protein